MTTPRVECAFGVDASAEPSTSDWVDVSAYLRDFDGGPGGRQRNLDRVEAGTMRFVLSNFDRRFDPTYVGGPYYPNVVPNAHIRLVEADTGLALFRGHVDGWPNSYPFQGKDAVVTVSATDAFKIMADALLPGSVWERNIQALVDSGTVHAWFRLGDPVGQRNPVDSGASNFASRVVGSPSFGETGLLSSGDTGATFSKGIDTVILDKGAFPGGTTWAIEILYRRPDISFVEQSPASEQAFQADDRVMASHNVILYWNGGTNGQLTGLVQVPGDVVVIQSPNLTWDDATHHAMLKRNGTTVELWEDGILVQSGSIAATGNVVEQVHVGNAVGFGSQVGGEGNFRGVLQELVIYIVATPDAADHSSWARRPFDGVRTDEAISDALDDIDWPAGRRQITTGLSTLQDHALGGPALEYIQRIVDTEAGIFGIDQDGDAVFFGRQYVQSQDRLTPVLVFENDAADGSEHVPYENIEFAHDDTMLVNEARVAREGGSPFTYQDQASITRYQKHGWDGSNLLHDNDDETKDHARFVVQHRKDFRTEIRSLTVNMYDPRVDVATLLGVFDGNSPGLVLVEVIHTLTPNPDYPTTADPIVGKYRVEQVSHSGQPRPRSWTVTLRLSPWDEDVDVPWILGDPVYGVLNSTTRLGF